MLSELVAKGLVKRVRQKGDRRIHSLQATEKGLQLHQVLSIQIEERLSRRIASLTSSEQDELLRGLAVLSLLLVTS